MHKIIVNYTSNDKAKRLVLDRDLPFGREVLYALLYLHALQLVSLNNVLTVKEVCLND